MLESLIIQKGPDNSDARRDIFDLLDDEFPTARHVSILVFKERVPGKPWVVGNHYHHDWERFRIVQGTIRRAVFEDVGNKERNIFENLALGTIITVPPMTAHSFLPAAHLVLVGALQAGFNPKDLNPYRIMDDDGNLLPSPSGT